MEEKLWQDGLLGTNNLLLLSQTLLYLMGIHFALHGRKEPVNLTINNFTLCELEGSECLGLGYTEGMSKTFQGGLII